MARVASTRIAPRSHRPSRRARRRSRSCARAEAQTKNRMITRSKRARSPCRLIKTSPSQTLQHSNTWSAVLKVPKTRKKCSTLGRKIARPCHQMKKRKACVARLTRISSKTGALAPRKYQVLQPRQVCSKRSSSQCLKRRSLCAVRSSDKTTISLHQMPTRSCRNRPASKLR